MTIVFKKEIAIHDNTSGDELGVITVPLSVHPIDIIDAIEGQPANSTKDALNYIIDNCGTLLQNVPQSHIDKIDDFKRKMYVEFLKNELKRYDGKVDE